MTNESTATLSEPFQSVLNAGAITERDVRQLRHAIYSSGPVTESEAEALVAVNDGCRSGTKQWDDLLIEALVDFLVHQNIQRGVLTETAADWLHAHILEDGVLKDPLYLDLLIKCLEAAYQAPDSLLTLALELTGREVANAQGGRGAKSPACIDETDIKRIRRLIFSIAGEGHMGVGEQEAAFLFELNDTTDHENNHPEWSELFVRGIASFAIGAFKDVRAGRIDLPPGEEGNIESRGVGGFMKEMFLGRRPSTSSFAGVKEHKLEPDEARMPAKTAPAQPEIESIDRAKWLANRIGREGGIDENEQAVLDFLATESPELSARLDKLIPQLMAR